MTLTISVVTPSYNQGKYIERTIQSVLSQGIPGLEVVVFDNLSDDQTVGILGKYEGSLRWISERDKGQAEAVNKGIQSTKGEIIGWLNSDDIYYPGALKTVLDYFKSHPETDVLYGDADHIDENDRWIENYPTEAWNFDRLKEVCYLCQPAVFFRRRILDRVGFLNEKLHFCLDYEYWLRLGLAGITIDYLPQKLAGSRLYRETKTLGSPLRFHKEINDMFSDLLGYVPDQWLYNYAHVFLDNRKVPRTDRVRFPFLVSVHSLLAALQWNKRISRGMMKMTFTWMRGSIHTLFRRAL
jgi:glycosyltransferase involved in cell wall biosynthesis